MIRTMLTCHWTARRVQRYLDADPSAPLTEREVERLTAHVAACRRCGQLLAEHRALGQAMARWSAAHLPAPESVERAHQLVDRIVRGELR